MMLSVPVPVACRVRGWSLARISRSARAALLPSVMPIKARDMAREESFLLAMRMMLMVPGS